MDVYVFRDKSLVFQQSAPSFGYLEYAGTLRKPFVNNGQNEVIFDLNNILKNYVSTQLPSLSTGTDILKVRGELYDTEPIVGYSVKYGVYEPLSVGSPDGTVNYKRQLDDFENKYVMNAALPFVNDTSTNNSLADYRNLSVTGDSKFLTNAPQNKIYHPDSNFDSLYFIHDNRLQTTPPYNGDATVTFSGVCNYEFYDGTNEDVTQLVQSFDNDNDAEGLFIANISSFFTGIDSNGIRTASSNKKVKKITFHIENNAGRLTEDRTFFLPFDLSRQGETVVWQNNLGCFDSFYFTGIKEDSISRQAESYINVLDEKFESGFQVNKQYDIKVTNTVTLNSGWVNEDHFNWLKEILSSPKVYLTNEDRLFSYVVSGFDYSKNNQTNQYNMELQLTYTIENNAISQ